LQFANLVFSWNPFDIPVYDGIVTASSVPEAMDSTPYAILSTSPGSPHDLPPSDRGIPCLSVKRLRRQVPLTLLVVVLDFL